MLSASKLTWTSVRILIIPLQLLSLVYGCASRPLNDRIDQVDPDTGYRPFVQFNGRENNDPATLFVLSFSGGGTRAASFSFGVLEELNR